MLVYNLSKMKLKNYLIIFIAATLFASCKKDFLVQTPPTAVPVSSAIQTDNDMADAVNGMYASMRASSLFGQTIPVLGDLLADNTYVSFSNSSRFLPENNYTIIPTNQEASNIWTQGYFAIVQANRIINSSLTVDATVSQLRGEAYTARALIYLELVNFYGASANVSPGSPGVPIVKGYTTPFILPARNTVADNYKQIISDLDSADLIMPAAAIATTYPATNSELPACTGSRAYGDQQWWLYAHPGCIFSCLLGQSGPANGESRNHF
jgi:hypothetical protein